MLQTNCEVRKMNNYFKNKLKDRLTYCKSWKHDIDMYLANKEITKQADIVVAAVGRPLMVKKDWIKEGAVVIDVGINRVDHPDKPGKTKLVGDVDYDDVFSLVSAITPVPGGVGPMTIACLLKNTVDAAFRQQ